MGLELKEGQMDGVAVGRGKGVGEGGVGPTLLRPRVEMLRILVPKDHRFQISRVKINEIFQ